MAKCQKCEEDDNHHAFPGGGLSVCPARVPQFIVTRGNGLSIVHIEAGYGAVTVAREIVDVDTAEFLAAALGKAVLS